jgi:hypothetical protein
MSKLSPRATKALSELEAMAKSKAAERAAKPKLSPADRIDAVARDFVMAQVAMAKPAAKPPAAAPVSKPKPKPKPALTSAALGGSGTTAEKLQAISNVAAGSAPCLLTREQLGSGPSEQTLRRMRFTRDRLEAEAKKQAERDRIGIALAVGHGVKEFEPSTLSAACAAVLLHCNTLISNG